MILYILNLSNPKLLVKKIWPKPKIHIFYFLKILLNMKPKSLPFYKNPKLRSIGFNKTKIKPTIFQTICLNWSLNQSSSIPFSIGYN
jgi:hypothetical protein